VRRFTAWPQRPLHRDRIDPLTEFKANPINGANSAEAQSMVQGNGPSISAVADDRHHLAPAPSFPPGDQPQRLPRLLRLRQLRLLRPRRPRHLSVGEPMGAGRINN